MDPTSTNVAICEALGLDATRIRKNGVTIQLDGNLGPVVTVEYQKLDAELSLMLTALKRYKLVPIDDDPGASRPPPPSPYRKVTRG